MEAIYYYLTDFCINSANLLGINYQQFNILLFLGVFPGALLILTTLNLRRIWLRKKG